MLLFKLMEPLVIKDIQNSLGLVLHFPQFDMLLIAEHKDIKLRTQLKKNPKPQSSHCRLFPSFVVTLFNLHSALGKKILYWTICEYWYKVTSKKQFRFSFDIRFPTL